MQPPFLSRIRAQLPQFHRAERKLAGFLLAFPGDVASYDAQELARLSGVSKATVSRFVRRIGFENFEAARRSARRERQFGMGQFPPQTSQARGVAQADSPPDATPLSTPLALTLREEWDNIARTFEQVDPAALDSLAAAILAARRVWLIGQRIGESYTGLLYWQLVDLVSDMQMIAQWSAAPGEVFAQIHSDDLVICVTLPPHTAVMERALQEVVMIGAPCAVISDEAVADDPRFAWHFRCRIDAGEQTQTLAAVSAICHQIVRRTTRLARVIPRDQPCQSGDSTPR